jgi:hypothetical protein
MRNLSGLASTLFVINALNWVLEFATKRLFNISSNALTKNIFVLTTATQKTKK